MSRVLFGAGLFLTASSSSLCSNRRADLLFRDLDPFLWFLFLFFGGVRFLLESSDS